MKAMLPTTSTLSPLLAIIGYRNELVSCFTTLLHYRLSNPVLLQNSQPVSSVQRLPLIMNQSPS